MHSKSLQTLEFFKVLARLAEHTSFSAGRELAEALRPESDPVYVARALRETREALHLLEVRAGVQFGGAHDVRPQVVELEPRLREVVAVAAAGRADEIEVRVAEVD